MKTFIYILMGLALALIIFNITQLDFEHLTEGNSLVALIGIVASLCAICILQILHTSMRVAEKTGKR
jgi:coenzyme F420-reducing hydrogenase alpha subunit